MFRRKSTADGFIRTMTGKLKVRDAKYMKWLHDHKVAPLETPRSAFELGYDPNGYDQPKRMTLHHFGKERRDNDALVVPLEHGYHLWAEEHPAHLYKQEAKPEWWLEAAFNYFCYQQDDINATHEGFARWVVLKLAQENGYQP